MNNLHFFSCAALVKHDLERINRNLDIEREIKKIEAEDKDNWLDQLDPNDQSIPVIE